VLLENTFVPTDMGELADHLTSEELEEFKEEIEKEDSLKFPEIDTFIQDNPHITYIKVNKLSNESINDVFHTLICVSRKSKKELDIHSQLTDESELVKKTKEVPIEDARMKTFEDINDTDKAKKEEEDKKK